MDTLIIIVLLVGAIVGFMQGAFKQIANFVGVMVGIFLATILYDRFGSFLASTTGTSEGVGNIFSFILIAVLVPTLLGWLATWLTKMFAAIHLGLFNRLIGAGIGALCYGLLMSFAFNLMDFSTSRGGMRPDKLEERSDLYYAWKHASQFAVPDVIIVTDSTEEAHGAVPRHGIKSKLPPMLGGEKEEEQ